GINPDSDIERQPLSVEDSVAAIRDGTIDAFFWSGGLPTSSVTDLATSDPIVLLPTAEYTDALREKYGKAYEESTIPAGTYEGFDEEVPTIAVPNLLVVNESMDEETAYGVTKLLFDRKAELERVHPEAKNLNLETARDVAPLELHPGAQRYFDEAG
ncbi:MAG: TAXI family TRAP transporter solute-binding subunit, partial [Actinomycetota bacterium]|nr:TAXI family TRAP transporter solute-binding subunit [Actinomycetota bacterium]